MFKFWERSYWSQRLTHLSSHTKPTLISLHSQRTRALVWGTSIQVNALLKIKGYLRRIWGRRSHHLKFPKVLNNDDVASTHGQRQGYTLLKTLIKSACFPRSQGSCVVSRDLAQFCLRTGQRIACAAFLLSVSSKAYSTGLHLGENAG